jgi:tRNA(Arg) A34 adenosine deaminase TadA
LAEQLRRSLQNFLGGCNSRRCLHSILNFMNDTVFLQRAISLSEQSTEPVKCACVLVRGGEVLAEAFNSQRADEIAVRHAEVKAVTAANQKLGKKNLEGVTAYCSCEPCVMCLTALSLAKVERIVYNQTMKEVSGGMPMGELDSAAFAKQYLNFVPKLDHLLV